MIDETKPIHTQVYDDEHEEWIEKEMTIAEYLDAYTDEGCPEPSKEPCPDCVRREAVKDLPSATPALSEIKDEIMAIGNWRRKSEIPNAYLVQAIEILERHING